MYALNTRHFSVYYYSRPGIPASSASAQESPPPSDKKVTLPPVTVRQSPGKRAKKPSHVKKKSGPQNLSQEQAPPPAQAGIESIDRGGLLGPEALPGRGELSTAVSALPAASTTIDAKELERVPVASYGDIFRSLPGFNIANYGQGALGYGLSMRGYTDAEHGRDIAYFIDGVPVNDISSIHTPNYADLTHFDPGNGPEHRNRPRPIFGRSGRLQSRRGRVHNDEEFRPLRGPQPFWRTPGSGRGLATYGSNTGTYEPYFVVEGYHTDGYRDNSDIDRYNTFDKVTIPLEGGDTLSFRAQAYGTTSGAPGYLNRDALQAGLVSPTAAINPTDGVDKTLQDFVMNYASGGPVSQQLTGLLYLSHDIFTRWADFDTPSGQRVQSEERETLGGKVRDVWTGEIAGVPAQLLTGASWRTDFIDDFQAQTINLQVIAEHRGRYEHDRERPCGRFS